MKINKLGIAIVMALVTIPAFSQVAVTGVKSAPKGSKISQPGPESTKSYTVLAPGKYEALYEYSINTKKKGGGAVTENYNVMLQISDNSAKCSDYTAYLTDSLASSGASDDEIAKSQMREYATEHYFVPEILQNVPEGTTTVTDVIAITSGEYTEPFADMQWELTDSSAIISGFNCTKATATYGGREWEAWYTDEIPSSFGPWKLSGLPGLIVKAEDSQKLHSFTLISFRPTTVPLMKTKDARTVKIDRRKFISMRNKYGNSPIGSVDPSSITEISVRKDVGGNSGAIWVNGVQVRMPANIYVPLELE